MESDKEPKIVVLDAGTGAARATVWDIHGKYISSEYSEWRYEIELWDGIEVRHFDADAFWNKIADSCKRALESAGVGRDEVVAVTSTSQREGMVLIDQDGKEVYAAPNLDFRGYKEAAEIEADYGDLIYRITGHWPHAIFPAARFLWFKKHEPDLYESSAKFLMLNDWILYRLSGAVYSEPTNASETLLYDLHSQGWSTDLIEKMGLDRRLFPELVSPGTEIGRVHKTASLQTGIEAGVPVFAGGADTQCALLGSGGISEGELAIVSGTSTPIQVVSDTPIIDPHGRVWTGRHLVSNKWVLDSNVRPSGVIYRWLRDSIYNTGEHGNAAGYKEMDRDASEVPRGAEGAYALLGPSISKVRNQPDIPPMFIGLNPNYEERYARRGVFTRSVLENIAYAVKGNYDQLDELMKGKIGSVHITGGGSSSNILVSIIAALLKKPVNVAGTTEATSLGAAMCAAAGSIYTNTGEAVERMYKKGSTVEPDREEIEIYEELYGKWKNLYDFFASHQEELRDSFS